VRHGGDTTARKTFKKTNPIARESKAEKKYRISSPVGEHDTDDTNIIPDVLSDGPRGRASRDRLFGQKSKMKKPRVVDHLFPR